MEWYAIGLVTWIIVGWMIAPSEFKTAWKHAETNERRSRRHWWTAIGCIFLPPSVALLFLWSFANSPAFPY